MRIEINGIEYDNFTSSSVEVRLDALCRIFTFTAAVATGEKFPFSEGDPCRILVAGELVLTGHIEVLDFSFTGDTHSVLIEGRDNTGDLVDSSLSSLSDIRAPISLKSLIEKVIKHIGASIKVIDEANPDPFNASEDVSAPEPGDGAYQFIEEHARKRNVLLTSNADGDLVITRGSGLESAGALQNVLGATDNNVLTGGMTYDQTGRYNTYRFASTLNPLTLFSAGGSTSEIVKQGARATDSEIRPGRQMALVSEGPYSSKQNRDRAAWEANVRKARGRVGGFTVQGHRTEGLTGDLWAVNTLVPVIADFLRLNDQMLIHAINFRLSAEEGRQTVIGVVEKNAYSLILDEPVKPTGGIGKSALNIF